MSPLRIVPALLAVVLVLPAWSADPPAQVKALDAKVAKAKEQLAKLLADNPSGAEGAKAAYQKSLFDVSADAARLIAANPKAAAVPELASLALKHAAPRASLAPVYQAVSAHHLANPKAAEVFKELADEITPDAMPLVIKAAESAKSDEVRHAAFYALARADFPAFAEAERKGKAPPVGPVVALLDKLIKQMPDATTVNRKGETVDVVELGRRKRRALDTLSVGKPAPEFAAEDLAGKPVKLADLKGKVVVMDIWATWCGPCKAMIPHERELTTRLKNKKFALVSVSADAEKETLTTFLKTEPMPWTHWWAGKASAAMEAYQVRAFPTIFVIDAKGVIRFKGVRGKEMDAAVDTLLREAGGS